MRESTQTAFRTGDTIFHGSGGVCVVEDICTPNTPRTDPNRTYYRLRPVYDKGSVIYTPTDGGGPIVRRPMTREQALGLVQAIPYLDLIRVPNERAREEAYREALRTNDCRECLRVIKTLCLRNHARREHGKRTTAVDERFLAVAENLLFGELAFALDKPLEEVERHIGELILRAEQREEQCS